MPTPTPDLSTRLRQRLGLAQPAAVNVERTKPLHLDGYPRERIEYRGREGDVIPAFLFTPTQGKPQGGVVVFHQHNGQFHVGKSEVASEMGDAYQGFGPALARRGLTVLAPDALTSTGVGDPSSGVTPSASSSVPEASITSTRICKRSAPASEKVIVTPLGRASGAMGSREVSTADTPVKGESVFASTAGAH